MDLRHDAATLIRAGRLVEASWLFYRGQLVESGVCAIDETHLRAAFFSGAQFMFDHIVNSARVNADGSSLQQMRSEFDQFEFANMPVSGNA
jgi:hypothetical protein